MDERVGQESLVRLMVLGGDGMLGHQLLVELASRHDVTVTLRREVAHYADLGLFDSANAIGGVEVTDDDSVLSAFAATRPEAVINAVGIVKQRPLAAEHLPSLQVNAVFPHRLALICRTAGARLVHISTDCVFSGRQGGYREDDEPDAVGLYGRSKHLGEIISPGCITLRTSIIGLEVSNRTGLVEWFLGQIGPVKGYRRAVFSGLTTVELARVIERILSDHPAMSGLWHVASNPINKYDLLRIFGAELRLDVEVVPDDEFVCDRSLDATAFHQATGYVAPDWHVMLHELAGQARNRMRRAHGG